MKKILLSSASAILAVIGFSAFKSASTSTVYWFPVTSGIPTGSEVLKSDITQTFPVAKTLIESPTSCGTTGSNICELTVPSANLVLTAHGNYISGFTANFTSITPAAPTTRL